MVFITAEKALFYQCHSLSAMRPGFGFVFSWDVNLKPNFRNIVAHVTFSGHYK